VDLPADNDASAAGGDAGGRPVVIVSNRGPVTFSHAADGSLVARRGSGGLVSGLAPLVAGTGATWVAAALSDADRDAAAAGPVDAGGFTVRTLAPDPATFAMAYDVVCNAWLWFVHHGLFDAARRPVADRRFARAWQAYTEVNDLFAKAVAEQAPPGAVVLVQDYHLCLMGRRLASLRSDIDAVHFSHTPFTGPDGLALLPDFAASDLLDAMGSFTACGFHATRWARRFEQCCAEVLGTEPATFVSPLGPDAADLATSAAAEATTAAAARLDAMVGDRALIVRVDRIELSKNLLRGFRAFDLLLTEHPEWRERVVFAANVYPSRQGLPEYLAYRQEVEGAVTAINRRWSTASWTPVLADFTDDYPGSVAALTRYDVLLVNPVRDGLNLVAKEGPLVNTNDGVLVLSTEAGAAEELGSAAVMVNPFDVAGTADALHRALTMDAGARAIHAGAVRDLAGRHTPATWLADQLAAANGR
jgi:trehalose 6-phosphate synthase